MNFPFRGPPAGTHPPWYGPANPPLPTPQNLPSQRSADGSHISMLISESDDGLRTSCTRQCAGIIAGGCCGGAGAAAAPLAACPPAAVPARPPPPALAGAGPSGIICALVIVALC